MGLLDHLWDDTVAGPRPENGLGKLRKHHTFSFRPSSGNDQPEGGSARSNGEDSPEDGVKVTRSIMIVKPPGYQGGSAPVSPAGSTPPLSPFSPPLSPFSDFNLWSEESNLYSLKCECMRFTNEKGPFWDVNGANAGGKEPFRFRRRSTSDAFDKAAGGSETGPRSSPSTYGM